MGKRKRRCDGYFDPELGLLDADVMREVYARAVKVLLDRKDWNATSVDFSDRPSLAARREVQELVGFFARATPEMLAAEETHAECIRVWAGYYKGLSGKKFVRLKVRKKKLSALMKKAQKALQRRSRDRRHLRGVRYFGVNVKRDFLRKDRRRNKCTED